MTSFIHRLFSAGKAESPEEQQARSGEREFDILKYDGIRALHQRNYPHALRCLERALAIRRDAEAARALMTAYVQTDRLEEACRVAEAEAAAGPDDAESLLTWSSLLLMREEYRPAREAAGRAVAAVPDDPRPHLLLAKAWQGEGNPLQAVAELTLALSLREDYAEALLLRGTLLAEMGQLQEAAADAGELARLLPDDDRPRLLQGGIALRRGDFPAAAAVFGKAVEANPFNEEAYLGLSRALCGMQQPEEALARLDEAVEINPESARLCRERGRLRLLSGDREGSAADLKRSLELDPDGAKQIEGEFRNYEKPFVMPPSQNVQTTPTPA